VSGNRQIIQGTTIGVDLTKATRLFERYGIDAGILFTIALFAVASFLPIESRSMARLLTGMWGINHLHFLPKVFSIAFWIIALILFYLMAAPIKDTTTDKIYNKINDWLWGGRILPRLIFIAALLVAFYLCRVRTPLLGDGWTWLAVFGHGKGYIHKWAEPASIPLLRFIQSIFSGYTRESALAAFQLLSIAGGGIFVWNIIDLIGRLCQSIPGRMLSAVTLLFSGAILLFFGYIEFYPITWAAVSIFLNLSIKYIREDRGLWAVFLSFFIALSMHVQVIYFLPGVAYLAIYKIRSHSLRRFFYILLGIAGLFGLILLIWLYNTRIEVRTFLLPPFEGRPPAPEYSIFSVPHLIDIINITLLVFPGFFILFFMWYFYAAGKIFDHISIFLAFLSAGALSFLFSFGAAITMGRDWDIMALSLLPLALLLLYRIDRGDTASLKPYIPSYIVLSLFMTVSFIYATAAVGPSEKRFRSLLNSRTNSGWVIYLNYLSEKGDKVQYNEIMKERVATFPELVKLTQAYDYLEKKDFKAAMKLANELLTNNPNNPDYLQIFGNLLGKEGHFDAAVDYYKKALRLRPYSTTTMNELGQLYLKQNKFDSAEIIFIEARQLAPEQTFLTEGLALAYINQLKYDSASAYADTLFSADKNSPGGHLIKMVLALRNNDRTSARHHFSEYCKYGEDRSDYTRIIEYYKPLIN
jgi:tetratricopeptide (TPR) repeat protein